MKPETFLKAMNDIDDEFIIEADKQRFRLFSPSNLKMALSVATACLFIVGSIMILPFNTRKGVTGGPDTVNAPVNSYFIEDRVFDNKKSVEKSVDDDGIAVTTVMNEENQPEYSVRKVDENILEVFNLPSCNFEITKELNGISYKIMGNDSMAEYVFWNRNGYNYLLSFVGSCDVDTALDIAKGIE